jgi:hypothetical protein
VDNIWILMHPNRSGLPHNFPCNLLPDIKVGDELRIIVEPTCTPQPNYPVRSITPRKDMFTIRIAIKHGRAGFDILNVRRTGLTPTRLLVVVDPKKTIRECLKDDGRFSAEVLTGRYTHLECVFRSVC